MNQSIQFVAHLPRHSRPNLQEISLRTLRDAVARPHPDISQSDAMRMLVKTDLPNIHRDLERVLANEQNVPTIRVVAALHLAGLQHSSVPDILLAHANTKDAVVQEGVFRALGMCGGKKAHTLLLRLRNKVKGHAAKQATFSMALIAHRLQLSGPGIAMPQARSYLKTPATGPQRITVHRATPEEAEFCLRCLGTNTYGLEPAEKLMYKFQCSTNNWMVLFNNALADARMLSRLQGKRTLLGLVAVQSEVTERFMTSRILFTEPTGKTTVSLLAASTVGQPVLAGKGSIKKEQMHFAVHALRTAGAFPISIEGQLSANELQITRAEVLPRVVRALRPKRMKDALRASSIRQ